MVTLILAPTNTRPQAVPPTYLAAADRLRKLLWLRAVKREIAAARRATGQEVRS